MKNENITTLSHCSSPGTALDRQEPDQTRQIFHALHRG